MLSENMADAQPGLFQGSQGFLEWGHFDKYSV